MGLCVCWGVLPDCLSVCVCACGRDGKQIRDVWKRITEYILYRYETQIMKSIVRGLRLRSYTKFPISHLRGHKVSQLSSLLLSSQFLNLFSAFFLLLFTFPCLSVCLSSFFDIGFHITSLLQIHYIANSIFKLPPPPPSAEIKDTYHHGQFYEPGFVRSKQELCQLTYTPSPILFLF